MHHVQDKPSISHKLYKSEFCEYDRKVDLLPGQLLSVHANRPFYKLKSVTRCKGGNSKGVFCMNHSRKTVLWLTQTAVLAAIIIVMAFTPLGYLHTLGLEITFMMIPVVVGSIIIGPAAGAVLGCVFGITSFLQCFGMSTFGGTILAINPFFTLIVCIPTRTLSGWIPGLIYRGLHKVTANKLIPSAAASLFGALLNTLFFMSTLMLLFGRTEYIRSLMGEMSVIPFVLAFVGLQGLIEAIITFIVGGVLSAALLRALKRN